MFIKKYFYGKLFSYRDSKLKPLMGIFLKKCFIFDLKVLFLK
ncbi:hypothetical protein B4102_0479 [Heyndrickxia sporothermodurans]|uniref:Uncharacterized protein n=1 Tax=Heyndrickxia sporothermodurans TaxID=46224 RepID=A0A150L6D7_9BACI|nr:hypothetical protein B4102_0479 [Heyndrickxia sporothermodurans]